VNGGVDQGVGMPSNDQINIRRVQRLGQIDDRPLAEPIAEGPFVGHQNGEVRAGGLGFRKHVVKCRPASPKMKALHMSVEDHRLGGGRNVADHGNAVRPGHHHRGGTSP
jgi:hypothetical protein